MSHATLINESCHTQLKKKASQGKLSSDQYGPDVMVCRSVLQCVAVCCDVLQWAGILSSDQYGPDVMVCCSVL